MGIFCLLIVNDDFRCQHIASQVLQHCNHEELYTGRRFMDAVNAISERRDSLNPVLITNVHRLGEKGSQILNQIRAQLNFEIIYMTPDDQMVELNRSEKMNVSAYAVKISNLEDINCLWESIVAKEKAFHQEETNAQMMMMMAIEEVTEAAVASGGGDGDDANDDDESRSTTHQKRKRKETKELTEQSSQGEGSGGGGGDDDHDHPVEKKPRVVWTKEMHRKFLEAIEILGPDKTFPKKIVELMNEPGLTRENVASHLQKYRLCLKRNQEEAAAAANSNNGLTSHYSSCFFSSSFHHHHHPFGSFPYRQESSCGRMISSMPSLGLLSSHHRSSFPFTSFRRIYGDDEKTKNTTQDGCLSSNANAPWNSESVKSFIGLRFTNDGKSLQFGQTTTRSGSGNNNEKFPSVGTEISEHSNSLEAPPNSNTLSEKKSSHQNYNVSDYISPPVFPDSNDFEQETFLALLEETSLPAPVPVPVPVPDDYYYCTFQQSHDDHDVDDDDDDEPLQVLLNNSQFLHEIPTSWNDNSNPELQHHQGNISSLEHISSGTSMDEITAAHSVLSVVNTPPQESSLPGFIGGGGTTAAPGNGTFSVQESSISPTTPYQILEQESSVLLPAPLSSSSLQYDDFFDCFQPMEDINSFLNETAECTNPQLFWKGVYDYAHNNNHTC